MTEQGRPTMVQAINLALMQEMERDDDVVVLGEDIGVDGGVYRATDGLRAKSGSNASSTRRSPRAPSWAWPSAWRSTG